MDCFSGCLLLVSAHVALLIFRLPLTLARSLLLATLVHMATAYVATAALAAFAPSCHTANCGLTTLSAVTGTVLLVNSMNWLMVPTILWWPRKRSGDATSHETVHPAQSSWNDFYAAWLITNCKRVSMATEKEARLAWECAEEQAQQVCKAFGHSRMQQRLL